MKRTIFNSLSLFGVEKVVLEREESGSVILRLYVEDGEDGYVSIHGPHSVDGGFGPVEAEYSDQYQPSEVAEVQS